MNAAEEYDVGDEVRGLRMLARDLKKEDVSLADCVNGLGIDKVLKELELKGDQCKDFLETFVKTSINKKYPPDHLADSIERFQKLCTETGTEYSAFVQEWEKTRDEKKRQDEHLVGTKNRLFELEKKLKSELEAADVTEEKLEEYLDTKGLLESHDLLLDDQKQGLKVLTELKSLGYNTAAISSLIEKHGSIETRCNDLQKNLKCLEKQHQELENKIPPLQSTVERLESRSQLLNERSKHLKEPLDALGDLNDLGLEDQDIISLRDIIAKTGHTVPSFKKQVEKLGSVESLLIQREMEQKTHMNHIANLENTKAKLQQDIEYLDERKKSVLEKSLTSLDGFNDRLQSIGNEFKVETTALEKEIKNRLSTELDVTLSQARTVSDELEKEYHSRVKKINNEAEHMTKKIEYAKDTVFNLGYYVGQLKNMENIANLVQGKFPKPEEKRLALASILDLVTRELLLSNRIDDSVMAGVLRDRILYR